MSEYVRRSQCADAGNVAGRRRFHRSPVSRRLARRPDILGCTCTDPWSHHCIEHPNEHDIDAATAAAEWLDEQGMNAIVSVDVARRIWRRGGEYRDLAVRIAPPQN